MSEDRGGEGGYLALEYLQIKFMFSSSNMFTGYEGTCWRGRERERTNKCIQPRAEN
jgi:hypothetical protein